MGRAPEEKKTLRGIVGDVNVMLGSYIRAQLMLASLTLVAYTVVLSILHLRYAFILGPLAGIFEFVPVVGPAVAAIIVFVIAVLTSYPHLIWLVVFLGIWRLVQDYINAPHIMGELIGDLAPGTDPGCALGRRNWGRRRCSDFGSGGGYVAHPLATPDQRKGSRCAGCSHPR